ncbi:MAG: hypothetical protein Q8M17_08880 [Actinomycetota bacterium]|nr:hypothetical protein [Actinomycetota bacterium]
MRIPRELPHSMEVRIQAVALASREDALFCGPSAAVLLGLPVPYRLQDGPVWVMVPEGMPRPRRRDVRARQADVVAAEISVAHGLRVTSPARTFVDLAPLLSLPDLVAVGDAAMRGWRVTPEELLEVIRRRVRYHGKVKARHAAPLLDPRAESPQESRLRMVIIGGGLPAPAVNLEVYDEWGGFIARCDLGYEDWKVAVEYDGAVHAMRARRFADATRRTLLREHGWYVVEVVADDLRFPHRAVAKVHGALRARGAVS